jgi:hypothetical protein
MKVIGGSMADGYCCVAMRDLVQSGDFVLHSHALALRFPGNSEGDVMFLHLDRCPKCGQRIELDIGEKPATSAAPQACGGEVRTRRWENYLMVIAGLFGVGIFIFLQLAFGIVSDLLDAGAAVAQQQCNVLYTMGNVPMYSCGSEMP